MNILIPKILQPHKINTANTAYRQSFKGLSQISKDTFEINNICSIENANSQIIRGRIVKKITLRDRQGNEVEGLILRNLQDPDEYYVSAYG